MAITLTNAPNSETGVAVIKVISAANEGGVQFGISGEVMGFYGVTPVAQQAVGTVVATTVAVSTSTWGFSTSTQANAIITAVATIQTAMKNLGLSS